MESPQKATADSLFRLREGKIKKTMNVSADLQEETEQTYDKIFHVMKY